MNHWALFPFRLILAIVLSPAVFFEHFFHYKDFLGALKFTTMDGWHFIWYGLPSN